MDGRIWELSFTFILSQRYMCELMYHIYYRGNHLMLNISTPGDSRALTCL